MTKGQSRTKHPEIAVFDTPEPDWFQTSPQKGTWASWLINSNFYGALIELPPKTPIASDDFFIVVKGCVVAYGLSPDGVSRNVFVDALRPGDMIWPMHEKPVHFGFETRSTTHLISVPKAAYQDCIRSIGYSETVLMAAELSLMTKHSRAVQFLFAKDLDRIKRVITMLADHPDAHPTTHGIEVMAAKEEIRMLAGVERRSGSRAFKALQDEGTVRFRGYKSFFYRPFAEIPA